MFPTTRWSELLDLRDGEHPERRALLDRLARRYMRPVNGFLRASGCAPDVADDLTQQFFAKLFEQNPFERLDRERGRFRGFLKAALRNFLIDSGRAARARAVVQPASGEMPDAVSTAPGAEEAFDRAFAREVLDEAIERLRTEMAAEGRGQAFELFDAYCLRDEDVTYLELSRRFGLSEDDVRNRLRECRRRLRALLRTTLGAYLGPHDDLEEELRFVRGG